MDWRVRRIIDNLWGPTGSIIYHIVLVTLVFMFFKMQKRVEEPAVEVIVKEFETVEKLEDITEELEQIQDIPTVVDAVAPPTVSLDQEPPQVDALTAGGSGVDISELNLMEAVSPVRFKGLYASRSAAGRQEALGKYAGGLGNQTEYAVKKALEWLKKHQEPDGSWGPHYKAAMTGLALLAFLAHGETTASEEYGPTIRNALRYLLKIQKQGVFSAGGPWHHPSQIRCYEHSIATYAICEAYGLTSIPFLKAPMEDAVQVIIDGQHEGGSWDYGYAKGPEANMDVSLGGWHIQALKAASSAGAENVGLKAALESAIQGLKSQIDRDSGGKFRYGTRIKRQGDNVMTGVAVLCMQLGGHALDAEARAGMNALEKMEFKWSKGPQDPRGVADWPFYAWYYITQARFHQGGKTWVAWNKQFAPVLCAMQNPDGSWCPAPESSEHQFGPVYMTSLGCLMLEVYYRFLPTYKPIEVGIASGPEKPEKGEDEIVIRFE